MTTVVVPATPPRPGLVCPDLPEQTPLSPAEAADLYEAALQDTLRTAEQAGGDLLVNYRSEETIPEEFRTDTDPEAEVRAVASEALSDVTAVRFETQVGSTDSARIGNTVTHLLREEAVDSVAVLRPTAPLVRRSTVDSGAMKLRTNGAVFGPTTAGDVYYAGFTDTVEFVGALADPAVETLTDRARDADRETEFLPIQPSVESAEGLASLVPLLRARVRAERVVPANTATFVHDHGLRVRDGDLVREE
jgi:hypothetical protein